MKRVLSQSEIAVIDEKTGKEETLHLFVAGNGALVALPPKKEKEDDVDQEAPVRAPSYLEMAAGSDQI